jgi:hypothetical protein
MSCVLTQRNEVENSRSVPRSLIYYENKKWRVVVVGLGRGGGC